MNPKLKAVERDPAEAVCSAVVKAGTGWLHEVRAGQILRIVDLCGNQSGMCCSTMRTTPPSVTM